MKDRLPPPSYTHWTTAPLRLCALLFHIFLLAAQSRDWPAMWFPHRNQILKCCFFNIHKRNDHREIAREIVWFDGARDDDRLLCLWTDKMFRKTTNHPLPVVWWLYACWSGVWYMMWRVCVWIVSTCMPTYTRQPQQKQQQQLFCTRERVMTNISSSQDLVHDENICVCVYYYVSVV